MEKSKSGFADRVTPVASLFISLCALGISIYSSYLTRFNNTVSVQPHIDIDLEYNPPQFVQDKDKLTKSILTIWMRNEGLGPAIIKRFSITLGKVSVQYDQADWQKLISAMSLKPEDVSYSIPKKDAYVSKNKEVPLLLIKAKDGANFCNAPSCVEKLRRDLYSLSVDIMYESVYQVVMNAHRDKFEIPNE